MTMANDTLKLFREQVEDHRSFATEEVNADGVKERRYFLEGIFIQGNVKNQNKRYYPTELVAEAVEKYTTTHMKTGRAVGELGHPDGPTVNLDRASHKFMMLEQRGNEVMGKAKILNTPMGKIVQSLIDDEVQMGVSLRGFADLREENGMKIITRNFNIVTPGDIVHNPSMPDAFVSAVMEEKEWLWENGIVIERDIDSYKQSIKNARGSVALSEAKLNAWQDFLSKLSR